MKLRTALLAIGGIGGGLALYNRRLERGGGRLPNRLGGEVRYYRWSGGDLAYSVAGEGEPLLLVHGWGGDHRTWRALDFGERRVIAPDLRGHGRSPAPDGGYRPVDLARDLVPLLDPSFTKRLSATKRVRALL